ncbi:hypothetical protein [Azospirillum doebereinerae]
MRGTRGVALPVCGQSPSPRKITRRLPLTPALSPGGRGEPPPPPQPSSPSKTCPAPTGWGRIK